MRDFRLSNSFFNLSLSPVSPETAFEFGTDSDDPVKLYLADILTTSANLAGICGVSVPAGHDSKGMPVGLQIMGPALGEKRILQAAYAYEQNSGVELKEAEL